MSRTPARVTQADVARVLRAVRQTNTDADVVVEPDGRIRIVPTNPNDRETSRPEVTGGLLEVDNDDELQI